MGCLKKRDFKIFGAFAANNKILTSKKPTINGSLGKFVAKPPGKLISNEKGMQHHNK
jgi:hypothetical protein